MSTTFHSVVKGQTDILLHSWQSKVCPCLIELLKCTILKGTSLSFPSLPLFHSHKLGNSLVKKSSPVLQFTHKRNFSLSSQITTQTVMPAGQVQPWECMEMPCAGIQIKQHKHASSVFKLSHSHTNTYRPTGMCEHITASYTPTLVSHRYTKYFWAICTTVHKKDLTNVVCGIYTNRENIDLWYWKLSVQSTVDITLMYYIDEEVPRSLLALTNSTQCSFDQLC